MKGYIYKITNTINKKNYIGKTTENPKTYWNMHKSRAENGYKKVLYTAMRKYGIENFTFNILEEYDLEKGMLTSFLNEREKANIKHFKTKSPKGYNLTDGGEGILGIEMSEEHKEKIRQAKLGKKRPEWVKEKLRKPKTEEHKEKLRNIPRSEEHRKNLSKVPRTKEWNEKNRLAKLGVYDGEKNPFYGKKHSEQTIKTIREKNRAYSNDPKNKEYNILNQPNRKAVAMLDKNSNMEIMRFISLRSAKEWLQENTNYKGDIGTIKKALNKDKTSYGYKWIEIEWKV